MGVSSLRSAWRYWRRRRSAACFAVVVFSLGVGLTSGAFSIVDAVLLTALPYDDPASLMSVWETQGPGREQMTIAPANYLDWVDQSESFEGFAADSLGNVTLAGSEIPEQMLAARVTNSYFGLLGVPSAFGRVFTSTDDPTGENLAILSQALAERLFGQSQAAIDKAIRLNDEPHTVIGVMPFFFRWPSPDFARQPELWLLQRIDPVRATRRGHFLRVIARLADDVSESQARGEMELIAERSAQAYPSTNSGQGVRLVSLRDQLLGPYSRSLGLMMWIAVAVLILSSANSAQVLFSHSIERSRDWTIRAALGAPRRRILREQLLEYGLLGIISLPFALTISYLFCVVARQLAPLDIARIENAGLSMRVAVVTAVGSFASACCAGLLPALSASRLSLSAVLAQTSTSISRGRSPVLITRSLVTIQLAFSLVLMVVAVVLVRDFDRLRSQDLGFDFHRMMTMELRLPNSEYGPFEKRIGAVRGVLDQLSRVRDIESVAVARNLPLARWGHLRFRTQREQTTLEETTAGLQVVTDDYFRTLGVRLLRGNLFDSKTISDTPRPAVISEAMVRRYWEGREPLGNSLWVESAGEEPYRIIGVVSDVRHQGFAQQPTAEIYIPYDVLPSTRMYLLVRGRSNEAVSVSSLRRGVWSVDRDLHLYQIEYLNDTIEESVAYPRFQTRLAQLSALVAVVLALAGLYGTMSHFVSGRAREIGIRMAMGAGRNRILGLVLFRAGRILLVALLLGTVGSLLVLQGLRPLLFAEADSLAFLATPIVFGLIGILACPIPAGRATRVVPQVILREG